MKRSWLITVIVCLLLLGGGAVILLTPQVVPYSQCSDVYKRYAEVEGVDATFIKDYKVNDTLRVDVTVLQATDSAGWERLRDDFGLQPPPPDIQAKMEQGKDLVSLKKVSETEVAAYSRLKRSVSIFHVRNGEEKHAIMYHNLDNNMEQLLSK